jgi:hypothetical protein
LTGFHRRCCISNLNSFQKIVTSRRKKIKVKIIWEISFFLIFITSLFMSLISLQNLSCTTWKSIPIYWITIVVLSLIKSYLFTFRKSISTVIQILFLWFYISSTLWPCLLDFIFAFVFIFSFFFIFIGSKLRSAVGASLLYHYNINFTFSTLTHRRDEGCLLQLYFCYSRLL